MNKVIVGLQYGDEGKGRIVDYFAKDFDYVCRFAGGGNAGHTLYHQGHKIALHQIPCGILHKKVNVVLGRGMVINISDFFQEIDRLVELGFSTKDLRKRIFIDDCAHVVTIDHIKDDEINVTKLGSTGRGIGPCYAEKAARTGLRIRDLEHHKLKHNREVYKRLKPFIKYPKDLSTSKVLCEGAQSIMLDISYGDFPYVTSSHTLPQYVPLGLKDSPRTFKNVGLFKAYLTKVSTKGFPTELHGEKANRLRKLGFEYGSTTGRPRKVGWLDIPQLNEAIKIGFVDEAIMTKADILKDMGTIKVCYKYIWGKPIYKTFKPWKHTDFTDMRFVEFFSFIQQRLNVPITFISNGPNRYDILKVNEAVG